MNPVAQTAKYNLINTELNAAIYEAQFHCQEKITKLRLIRIQRELPDGDRHLNANKVRMTSREKDPLSTKSPLKRYGFSSEGSPLSSKIFRRSKYCRSYKR